MKNKKHIIGASNNAGNTVTLFRALSDMNFLVMVREYRKTFFSKGFYFVYLHELHKYHITIDPSIYFDAEIIIFKNT